MGRKGSDGVRFRLTSASSSQAWRGTLARWRCQRLRAIYTIMRCFRRHKVHAYLAELQRQFQAVRRPPLYGRNMVWPLPPAVLQPFQDTCQALFCRYLGCSSHQGYNDT